jgi:hypothetical protein
MNLSNISSNLKTEYTTRQNRPSKRIILAAIVDALGGACLVVLLNYEF